MIFRSFIHSVRAWLLVLLTAVLTSCGGGSAAPAPTGLAVQVSESSATVSWNMVEGVEYWLFYGPTSTMPASVASMSDWIRAPNAQTAIRVASPLVVSGLSYSIPYSFSVNGRTDGGPGGPGATAVVATARPAGSSWTVGTSIGAGAPDLRGMASGGVFVAGGVGGSLYSSTDGATWSGLIAVTSNTLNGGWYYNTYKMVGDKGTVITSADAATWTAQASGTTQNLYAIAANGFSLNVAVGANGTIVTSADGITWSAAVSGTTRDLYAVNYSPYNSGTWIAVGAGGTLLKSADGVTWASVASNVSADLRGVANGLSSSTGAIVFTAVGAAGTVLNSADGTTWVAQTLPGGATLNAVSAGAQFVAVGNAGSIFTSGDAQSWVVVSPAPTSGNLLAVARGSLRYAAVGAGGINLLAR
jgi:hypothetical protein